MFKWFYILSVQPFMHHQSNFYNKCFILFFGDLDFFKESFWIDYWITLDFINFYYLFISELDLLRIFAIEYFYNELDFLRLFGVEYLNN